jgi:hypothetical protein
VVLLKKKVGVSGFLIPSSALIVAQYLQQMSANTTKKHKSSVIWKERNNRIFSRASKSAEQLLRSIQEEARAWILAGNRGVELVVPFQASLHGVLLAELVTLVINELRISKCR